MSQFDTKERMDSIAAEIVRIETGIERTENARNEWLGQADFPDAQKIKADSPALLASFEAQSGRIDEPLRSVAIVCFPAYAVFDGEMTILAGKMALARLYEQIDALARGDREAAARIRPVEYAADEKRQVIKTGMEAAFDLAERLGCLKEVKAIFEPEQSA